MVNETTGFIKFLATKVTLDVDLVKFLNDARSSIRTTSEKLYFSIAFNIVFPKSEC